MTIEYITEYGSPNNLDDLFERGSGIGQNTGFYSTMLAQDLGAMFAPRSLGADIGFNTGFIALNGQDLRNLFAKKGTVVTDLWIGTMTPGQGSSTDFGLYTTTSGNVYWGATTKTGGAHSLRVFQYQTTTNLTFVDFFQPVPTQAGVISMTYAGLTTQMLWDAGYASWICSGDFWGLQGKVGQQYNGNAVRV